MKKVLTLGLILSLGVISCAQRDDNSVAQITDMLRNDLQNVNYTVTNTMPLFEENTNLMVNNTITTNEMVLIEGVATPVTAPQEVIVPVTETTITQVVYRERPAVARPQIPSSLYVIQNEVYIKIGNDNSMADVSRNLSQKITVAVFPQANVESVDIYLYGIPTTSPLVRNNNTLIGYAKAIEFINGQAQFTRYWNARRADGRVFNPGLYNVYVEYHYKNANGVVVGTQGRFWGGNHRRWTVQVL